MKAVDANLLNFLKTGTQFVVPIYQRVYSWEIAECERLWDDIVAAGKHEHIGAHFTGSIVYVEKDASTRTSAEPDLIIDGQQRVTTVTLLLAALAARLDELPDGEREPVQDFSPAKIRGLYLTNPLDEGDRFFKLILSQSDKDALKAAIRRSPSANGASSRVTTNYEFFVNKLADPATNLVDVCLGIRKLVVVDVSLTRGADNPQLVFEAMNSTGKKLSQADLIRNFVLMDLPPTDQTRMYEGFWYPMEQEFQGVNESRFDDFVRHYLTLKTGNIPRVGDIYDAFKEHAYNVEAGGITREDLVVDLSQHARWFVAMAMGRETDPSLAAVFAEVEQLRATVVYPFTLRLYADHASGVISRDEFRSIVDVVVSYLFRRAVVRIPTNSLNKTFAGLGSTIDPNAYVDSILARFLTLGSYKRFPNDAEFEAELQTADLYHFQRTPYFFRKLENHGRKEEVSTADYTVEHIMPQNENPPEEWKQALGEDWKSVHERLLHTLGNLTLTGYNPEYSDRPFADKRDMAGGFKDSPLRLNEGLGQLETWNEAEIGRRAVRLAKLATTIWRQPKVREEILSEYKTQFGETTGFDWSATHEILEKLPAGRWTGYFYLAEAVGTSAQAVANHVSRCKVCHAAYRVLTWDGHLAEGFAWTDPNDDRDPKAVLESEGIVFKNGVADPEQKLGTEDLLALVDEAG